MHGSADRTFVHLSDIHFRRGRAGTKHDPDTELRNELVSDLRRLASRFSSISGIILTGDIAWGGHATEYEYAQRWIRTLAEQIRCSDQDIMVTPGNHDISRSTLKKNSGRIEKLQRAIRTGSKPSVCVDRLTAALLGPKKHLYVASLKAYNAFAKTFACDVSPDRPYWERRFPLGDGAALRIRGITSTWLSGPSDSENTPRLLYGAAQYTFEKEALVHNVVAGHHPPQNMIDGVEAARAFNFHCKLQLFGHKHEQWITKYDDTSVKIISGALHPDRREQPWTPRYNIFEVSGELTGSSARLVSIRIYPRRWSHEFRQFMADYSPEAYDFRQHEFLSA